MKKSNKKNHGITLIALVVTIIVLLILAGVTLSLIGGSDGILSRATNAVDKHEIATIKENVELKVAEDVERFHEAKYVDFSIDNAMTAYEYLKENTNKTIKRGNEEYQITYTDSTDPSKPDDNKIQVDYVKKGTKLSITGKISQTGVIIWDDDVQISDGNNDGSGTGGTDDSGETEKDIPLSISEPTWNGTNATVTVAGKKKGSTLQYKVGDDGEWKDIESGGSVTVPAGTKVEVCFFDGTNREIISSPKVLTLSYTVAYDGNGATAGSTANSSHEYGVAKALNSNGFVKDGFTFKGWNTSADGTGQAFEDGASVTNLSSANGATVTLFAQWEENLKPAVSAISASNYGDLVNYSANGVDDWKIFYNDGTNIYIISADFVPNSGFNKGSGILTQGTYYVYGSSKDALINWLMNNAYWNAYATGMSRGINISGATATGAPTLQQFVTSYNEKYGTKHTDQNTFSMQNKDLLYIPHPSGSNSTNNCWLVSINTKGRALWCSDPAGNVLGSQYQFQNISVRPLVCLPEGIKVEKGSDGKWTFSQ